MLPGIQPEGDIIMWRQLKRSQLNSLQKGFTALTQGNLVVAAVDVFVLKRITGVAGDEMLYKGS